jgi:ferredoxin-NADP reductase
MNALRTRWVSALLAPRHVDDYLELLDATWSVREIRARVVGVRGEADHATSLLLEPNAIWRGFRAGQFVRVSVDISGVRHERCFSLSSAPSDGTPLRLTIKSIPGGRVSAWAPSATRHDVLRMSQAVGEFIVPRPAPRRLLCISGGSGITPIVSIVRELLATGYAGRITCLHYARRDMILGGELAALARRDDRLEVVTCFTQPARDAIGNRARFSLAQLEACAPDWTECETYLCGPDTLANDVTALYHEHGAGSRLHVERFAGNPVRVQVENASARYRLVLARSQRVVDAHDGASLLEQAERSGIQPAHGCRMGICYTCKCTKRSGAVLNMLTGEISVEPNQDIQLCVSAPRSDVTLDL